MTENWTIQVSPKLADGTLINLRGTDPGQFAEVLKWATENAAQIVSVAAALQGVPPALAANVTHTQVVSEAPAQQAPAYQDPAPSPWSQPQQAPAPQFAQPAQQAGPPGPTCQHGAMEWKDFTSKAGNHVRGHFCTVRNSQCPPAYAPKGR